MLQSQWRGRSEIQTQICLPSSPMLSTTLLLRAPSAPASLPAAGKMMTWETSSSSGSERLGRMPPTACLRSRRLPAGSPPSPFTAGAPRASRNRVLTLARTSSRSSSDPWQPCPRCGASSKRSSSGSCSNMAHLSLSMLSPHPIPAPLSGSAQSRPLSPPHPSPALFYPSHPSLPRAFPRPAVCVAPAYGIETSSLTQMSVALSLISHSRQECGGRCWGGFSPQVT